MRIISTQNIIIIIKKQNETNKNNEYMIYIEQRNIRNNVVT